MSVAEMVEEVLGADLPVAFEAYDGSRCGPVDAPATMVLRSPTALQRIVTAPGELGLGRAYVAGDLGVTAVGVTLSRMQAELAQKRVAEAGLGDVVEIRLQDYRDVTDGPYDAISSIGMFEHVGLSQVKEYFDRCHALLRPQGRFLNHAIGRPPGFKQGRIARRGFIERYVFPDYEAIIAAHETAVVGSQPGYIDPASGLFVLTAEYLRTRGHCCDQGCRHCPYLSDG